MMSALDRDGGGQDGDDGDSMVTVVVRVTGFTTYYNTTKSRKLQCYVLDTANLSCALYNFS